MYITCFRFTSFCTFKTISQEFPEESMTDFFDHCHFYSIWIQNSHKKQHDTMQRLIESLEKEMQLKNTLDTKCQNNTKKKKIRFHSLFSCSCVTAENNPKFQHDTKRNLEKVKRDILEQLLYMHMIREKNTFSAHSCNAPDDSIHPHDMIIPDSDRVSINEAILLKLDEKYMNVLLDDYPRALEHGGVVDHVNHPIHTACRENKDIVATLLKSNPGCALQLNEQGRYPIETYLFGSHMDPDPHVMDHHHHHSDTTSLYKDAIRLFAGTAFDAAAFFQDKYCPEQ